MKLAFRLSNFSLLLLMAMVLGFTSCKNKKKVADISDPQAVKEQMEKEFGEDDDDSSEDITQKENNNPPRVAVKEPTKTERLETYFSRVASGGNTAASTANINEALGMFSNASVPVLIIIYYSDGTTDYDEPTTIKRYFEYLKDTGNNKAKVEEMVLDDYGKIKELVLKK